MPGRHHDLFAAYLTVLSQSAELVRDTGEHPEYERHLAEATRMAAALESGDLDELRRLITNERRHYGWSFLRGPAGDRTESAFTSFAEAVHPLR
jgi:hypothetical protein